MTEHLGLSDDGYNTTVTWACGRRDRINTPPDASTESLWRPGWYGCDCTGERDCPTVDVTYDAAFVIARSDR